MQRITMNIVKKLSLLTVLSTAVNYQVFSAEVTQESPLKQHSFGVQLAAGGIEYKNSNNDEGTVQLYSYYNYAFSQNFSLELGVNFGTDVEDWECHETYNDNWHCSTNNNSLFGLNADEVEYSNLVVAIKGLLPLSQRNSLYAKIGAQYYDYDINRGNKSIVHDSDIGLYLAAGWQYQWDMGLGMNAGYEAFDMGDLETFTLNVGINYKF